MFMKQMDEALRLGDADLKVLRAIQQDATASKGVRATLERQDMLPEQD